MIILKLFLHGKPNWYLPIEGTEKVNPYIIRLYADQLKDHLYKTAETIRKLQENGWYLLKTYGTMYYLEYCKFDITSEQAKSELNHLGASNDLVIEELDLNNVL
mgnify:CR=1 FL=1